jgi:hypothetical protein
MLGVGDEGPDEATALLRGDGRGIRNSISCFDDFIVEALPPRR